MRSRNLSWLITLLLLGLVFLFGVSQLLLVRFTKGDAFPPYSSLRADPLGTKAFADTVELLDGVALQRHLRPLRKLEPQPRQTVFFAGTNPWSMQDVPEEVVQQVRQLVANRSRAVITMYPLVEPSSALGIAWREAQREAQREANRPTDPKEQPTEPDQRPTALLEPDVFLGARLREAENRALPALAQRQTDHDLPAALNWHSLLYFELVEDDAWEVIYAINDQPVIIERQIGTGTLVMASDSWLLSNEAMRDERHPRLLAWLIGDADTVVMEESHLGVAHQQGVATLAREYGLEGAFCGLLLLAILFVWRSMATFMPRQEDAASRGVLEVSRDHTSGLINVLRRHLKPRDLITHCLHEWSRSLPVNKPHLQGKADEVQQLGQRQGSPVSIYQAIAAKLNKRT